MIEVRNRDLIIPTSDEFVGVAGDNKIEVRQFVITDHNLFSFDFKLDVQQGENKNIIDLDKTVEKDKIILSWVVKKEHIPNNGILYAQLRAFSDNEEIWHSKKDNFRIGGRIGATDYFPSPLPSEFEQMEQRVTEKHTEVLAAAEQVDGDKRTVAADKQTVLEKAAEALQSAANALASQQAAKTSEDNAKESETSALGAMGVAVQAMTDLLAMMGEDIATLTDGKLTPSQIPDISINDVFEVDEGTEEMLTLTAQKGDCALIMGVDEEDNPIVTDSYILAADDPTVLANWKKLGVSYVANAGHALTADNAGNANKINNKRLVAMTESQYEVAVKDESTFYAVVPDEE